MGRNLPDTLKVDIIERVPLALAEVERLYLMDKNGGLIDLYGPRTASFDLPIVRGLMGVDEEARRYRAERAGALLDDLQDLAAEVSEVFVLPSGDLRVVLRGSGEVLLLGEAPHRQRVLTFLSLRKDLVERCPDAEYFDLRFRGRIYAKQPAAARAGAAPHRDAASRPPDPASLRTPARPSGPLPRPAWPLPPSAPPTTKAPRPNRRGTTKEGSSEWQRRKTGTSSAWTSAPTRSARSSRRSWTRAASTSSASARPSRRACARAW